MREFNPLVVGDNRIYLNMVKDLFACAGLKALCREPVYTQGKKYDE